MIPQEGAFHRAPRPLMGWTGFTLAAVCVLFLLALAGIVLFAMARWATGQHVDLAGFAAVLGAAVPAGAYVAQMAQTWMNARHTERMDQQARGAAPEVPFVPSTPLPPSPENGPRPGDSL